MKTTLKYLFLTTAFGALAANAQSECSKAAASVSSGVSSDKGEVLNIVAEQVAANPNCACEVVKAAIVASKANKSTVAAIVQAAGNAAPDRLDLIVACATAAAPDAAANIQAAAAQVQGGNSTGSAGMNPLDGVGGGDQAPGGTQGANDSGSSQGQAGSTTGGDQSSGSGVTPTPVVTDPNP